MILRMSSPVLETSQSRISWAVIPSWATVPLSAQRGRQTGAEMFHDLQGVAVEDVGDGIMHRVGDAVSLAAGE